ncbi:LmrA/YxaF family transcription factor [Gordonia sp. KTR9]|uniref:LmrA/YxaF family transcription factor n=1 Tax=Gordonia sp. KTR9 TaxID=337191 RepID=UPI003FCDCB5F
MRHRNQQDDRQSCRRWPAAGARRLSRVLAQILTDSSFQAGCPVVSVVTSDADEDSQQEAAAILGHWHQTLCTALTSAEIGQQRAERLATLTVASIEGAIVLARAQQSLQPLDDVIDECQSLFKSALAT